MIRPLPALAREVAFAGDEFHEALPQLEGRDEQFLAADVLAQARQVVEDDGHLGGQFRRGRQQAQVRVKTRRGGVVVARAQMRVEADAVLVAADDHHHLAVGLQADQTHTRRGRPPPPSGAPSGCCWPRRNAP